MNLKYRSCSCEQGFGFLYIPVDAGFLYCNNLILHLLCVRYHWNWKSSSCLQRSLQRSFVLVSFFTELTKVPFSVWAKMAFSVWPRMLTTGKSLRTSFHKHIHPFTWQSIVYSIVTWPPLVARKIGIYKLSFFWIVRCLVKIPGISDWARKGQKNTSAWSHVPQNKPCSFVSLSFLLPQLFLSS